MSVSREKVVLKFLVDIEAHTYCVDGLDNMDELDTIGFGDLTL